MLRLFTLSLLISGTFFVADEQDSGKLTAPKEWGGETIKLPPGFAPDMKLKGSEHIRFAPGMMKPRSESFFSYAFVFEVQPEPKLTEAVVKEEILKYYRRLSKAVLNGKLADLDPSKFTLQLKRTKADPESPSDKKNASTSAAYTGTLDWIEPFVTKKQQTLNLEIQTSIGSESNYIFVCVSPLSRDARIWNQLHKIRDDYLEKREAFRK